MNTEEELRMLFSRNIKRYRSRLGVSQLDFANDAGLSPTFLSAIESGKKWVSPHTLLRLAKLLHVEVYELFIPETALPEIASLTIARCLDDAAASVRQSVEQTFERVRNSYL
jgi:transcriptional regulator with XRE-family HTH domain